MYYFTRINITLAVFNMIPVAPLDGSQIFSGYLMKHNPQLAWKIQSFGPQVLFGLIFLIIHFSKFELSFNISNKLILLSCSSVLLQVLVVVYYTQNNEIGSFSLFYNIVNLFILTFLYIYRNEMKVNYHLYWSFALLFLMGMEIRSIQTIGLGLN